MATTRRTAAQAALALLCSAALFPLQAQSQGRNQVLAQFPIREENSRAVVPVMVESTGPFWLILDSGMGWDGFLLFDTARVDLRALPNLVQARVPGAGAGEPSPALTTSSATFTVGGMAIKGHRIIMLTNGIFRGYPNDGVVGHSLLGHYAVEIDYDNDRMTLYEPESFRPDSGWTGVDLTFPQRPVPWLKVTVRTAQEPAVELDAYIDFASRETVEFLERPVNRFTTPATTEAHVIGRGLSGDVVARSGRVAEVTLGPFTLRDVPVQFTLAEVRQGSESGADAVVDSGLLRRFNLVFDYAHRKLWLKPNAAFAAPF